MRQNQIRLIFSAKNLGIGVFTVHLAGFSKFVILAAACQSIFPEILSQNPPFLMNMTNCQKFYLVIVLNFKLIERANF